MSLTFTFFTFYYLLNHFWIQTSSYRPICSILFLSSDLGHPFWVVSFTQRPSIRAVSKAFSRSIRHAATALLSFNSFEISEVNFVMAWMVDVLNRNRNCSYSISWLFSLYLFKDLVINISNSLLIFGRRLMGL